MRGRAPASNAPSWGCPPELGAGPQGGTFEPADIVVGKGRVVLEASAPGCAVYVYDQYGGDGWVTPESYPALEADHFAGQATAPRLFSASTSLGDLAAYSPEMGVGTTLELVRSRHGARHHAIELVAILRGQYLREPDSADVVAELARLGRAKAQAARSCAWRGPWNNYDRPRRGTHRTGGGARRAGGGARRAGGGARRRRRPLCRGRLRYLLGTKRARVGLALGRAVDRLLVTRVTSELWSPHHARRGSSSRPGSRFPTTRRSRRT